jgi:hypothetical protein
MLAIRRIDGAHDRVRREARPAVSAPLLRAAALVDVVVCAAAIVLALLSALATFLVLTGLTAIAPTHEVVVSVLLGNAIIAMVLIGCWRGNLSG